jgi:hypothetical protein
MPQAKRLRYILKRALERWKFLRPDPATDAMFHFSTCLRKFCGMQLYPAAMSEKVDIRYNHMILSSRP